MLDSWHAGGSTDQQVLLHSVSWSQDIYSSKLGQGISLLLSIPLSHEYRALHHNFFETDLPRQVSGGCYWPTYSALKTSRSSQPRKHDMRSAVLQHVPQVQYQHSKFNEILDQFTRILRYLTTEQSINTSVTSEKKSQDGLGRTVLKVILGKQRLFTPREERKKKIKNSPPTRLQTVIGHFSTPSPDY